MTTAVIRRIPDWQHECAVLAERRRRDSIDPMWLPELRSRLTDRRQGMRAKVA